MASRSPHTGTPARSPRVSRRQAQHAREELAEGDLSRQERRRLRSVIRSRAVAIRKRRGRLRHLAIAAGGALVVAAIAAAYFGLAPAIDAAMGGGMTGSFVVNNQVCLSKTGCEWVGTYYGAHGDVIGGLAYGGVLPAGDGPGSTITVRYPSGADQVYALHGSHTWVYDLLLTLLLGTATGAALWISPLGEGGRKRQGGSESW